MKSITKFSQTNYSNEGIPIKFIFKLLLMNGCVTAFVRTVCHPHMTFKQQACLQTVGNQTLHAEQKHFTLLHSVPVKIIAAKYTSKEESNIYDCRTTIHPVVAWGHWYLLYPLFLFGSSEINIFFCLSAPPPPPPLPTTTRWRHWGTDPTPCHNGFLSLFCLSAGPPPQYKDLPLACPHPQLLKSWCRPSILIPNT